MWWLISGLAEDVRDASLQQLPRVALIHGGEDVATEPRALDIKYQYAFWKDN